MHIKVYVQADTADYVYFLIQKTTNKVTINLDIKGFAVSVNIAERFAIWRESFEFH